MTKLEIIVNVAGAEQVAVEGVSFQHTNYLGLDQGMDWKHAALKVFNSQGGLSVVSSQTDLHFHFMFRHPHHELRVLPHGHDGAVLVARLQRGGGQERVH